MAAAKSQGYAKHSRVYDNFGDTGFSKGHNANGVGSTPSSTNDKRSHFSLKTLARLGSITSVTQYRPTVALCAVQCLERHLKSWPNSRDFNFLNTHFLLFKKAFALFLYHCIW